ncbi:MAG: sulfatase family protein [Bryobacteraceae bacterium]
MNPNARWSRRQWLAGAAAVAARAQAPSRPPNFVILFADDLGWGDLGCYGHPLIRTPNLDRMATEGARFTSFYAASPVCTPSRAGLLTGRYPIRAGQPGNTGPDTVGGLPLSEILLPQVLKPLGYSTMAIGKWHLGFQPEDYLPVRRGFDDWLGLPYSNDMIPPWVNTQRPLRLYRGAEPVQEVKDQDKLTPLYTDEAVRFIRAHRKRPFLLYLAYSMPHLPVSAPARMRGRSRGGLYGDVIETLDWSAGEIRRTLEEAGVAGDTLVVFTSDNGPWHNLPPRMLAGGVEPWHTGSAGPLRGAKGTTWEGGLRVPGIFWRPGRIRPQTVQDMASTLDLFPTLVSLAGARLPEGRVYDGFDLTAMLERGEPSPRREFFYCLDKRLEGVRRGPWKLRHAPGGAPELFHLERDVSERYDVSGHEPELAASLAARLKEFGREIGGETAG